MPANEQDNVHRIADYQQKPPVRGQKDTLKSGGGGGTYDDMEARVSNLERRFDRFETKLDSLIVSVAEVKGQLSALPSAATFGDIKGAIGRLEGRVDRLPTFTKVSALAAVFGLAVLIITKWSEIKAAFNH